MKDIEVKVKFVYYDLEDNLAVESVWAIKEGDYYRIKNIPFFAPNIAYDDLISVEDDEGELFYDDTIEESGNSTVQIIIYDENNVKVVTEELEKLGCEWEGSHLKTYISVNIPKEIEYNPIKIYLQYGRENQIFDYQEACLAHQNN